MAFRRILVIRPGAIGDLILTLPAISALRERFPGSYMELAGSRPAIDLLLSPDVVDRTASFDRAEFAPLFYGGDAMPGELRDYLSGFDLIVAYSRDPLLLRNLRKLRGPLVIPISPLPEGREHMVHQLSRPLARLGIELSDPVPKLRIPPEWVERARELLAGVGLGAGPLLSVHPGSGSRGKRWPFESFLRVGWWARGGAGLDVAFILGPAEEDLAGRIGGDFPFHVIAGMGLAELAGLLRVSSAFLGNDSGVAHMSAAVGTPTAVIFGPTDPAVWAPLGDVMVIEPEGVSCSPCGLERMRTCAERVCLSSTGEGRVIAKLAGMLGLDPGNV